MNEELKEGAQREPEAQGAPPIDKRAIRIEGLKLAGVGAVWLFFAWSTGAAAWLNKTGRDLPGLMGAVLLSASFGVVAVGPVLSIIGLFQAASGYRTKPARDIFGQTERR